MLQKFLNEATPYFTKSGEHMSWPWVTDNKYSYEVDRATLTFPPTDIYKKDGCTVIEMVVARYPKESLRVITSKNVLEISGEKIADEEGAEYVQRKIAARSFIRKFALDDGTVVKSTSLKDGVLKVVLETEVVTDTEVHHEIA